MKDPFANVKALAPVKNRGAREARGFVLEAPAGSGMLAQALGAAVKRNRYGEHLSLKRWFSEPDAAEMRAEAIRLIAPKAPREAYDATQWLFLDTETTGVCGGTGTYAFLVGVAWWEAAGLETEQFFMRDHNEEHSVLLALSERLAERRVLVTFNGKSFDWPLLETRYRMTRCIEPRAPEAHLDLLHPARHLWRLRLGSVRLTELERHVLGLDRGEDVPGELIPQAYFDFLNGADPSLLTAVFRHNQWDLRSLAALACRMLSLLAQTSATTLDSRELYGMSRLLDRRGERARARKLYAKALHSGLPRDAERLAQHRLASLAKRERDFGAANALWEELRGTSREGMQAWEELAIYYEHHAGMPERAAELVQEALNELRKAYRARLLAQNAFTHWQNRFRKRLERLGRKLNRASLRLSASESRGTARESN